ncbi:hypothetical protein B0H63DRAFT_523883 [Podospora didyma]|uniref:Rhodopsin domain-containing protein n=1 Tax=Podospora didyma TaxID=330526 RepID=A0AAE0NGM5_9PEZI|nr:hypothetical protein B0H63DRAFT_523883 [Podospora didyma]
MPWTERGWTVFAWTLSFTLLATLCVALRFISRRFVLGVLRPTDWLFTIGHLVSVAFNIDSGLGQPVADLGDAEPEAQQKAVYSQILTYNVCLVATKISILLLFLDIFRTSIVRKATIGALALVCIYSFYLILSSIFSCTPVQAFWEPRAQLTHCPIYGPKKFYADAGVSIATDFFIFALPMPVIRSMTLPWRQKLWLYFVFALGFFVCITSMIRIHFLRFTLTSSDPTWDGIHVTIWSGLEINVAIIAAGLLTLKPLVDKLFPGFLDGNPDRRKDESPGHVGAGDSSFNPPTISSPLPRHVQVPDMQMV